MFLNVCYGRDDAKGFHTYVICYLNLGVYYHFWRFCSTDSHSHVWCHQFANDHWKNYQKKKVPTQNTPIEIMNRANKPKCENPKAVLLSLFIWLFHIISYKIRGWCVPTSLATSYLYCPQLYRHSWTFLKWVRRLVRLSKSCKILWIISVCFSLWRKKERRIWRAILARVRRIFHVFYSRSATLHVSNLKCSVPDVLKHNASSFYLWLLGSIAYDYT